MASCMGEELPPDALYLDDDITAETTMALNRSLNIIDRFIGLTDNTHTNKRGYSIDWRGLAMMMKFDIHDISRWEAQANERAKSVINVWRKQDESPTIRKLLEFLRELQVYGLLRDANFIEAIVDDVQNHKRRVIQRRQEEALEAQKQIEAEERSRQRPEPRTRPAPEESIPLHIAKPEWHGDAKNQLVIGDATSGKKTYFHAFVCYAKEDIKFVKRLLKTLEDSEEYNLKLCVDARDFLVGAYQYTFTARIMEERCKRIVLIMSPDFVKTPMCEFQTEYALSLSPGSANKKILPVMYRTCDIPSGLKHIAGLYYTNDELKEWFWARLGGSLVSDLQWNEEIDHRCKDWDQLSLTSDSLGNISKTEILGSPNPKRNGKSSSSSSSRSRSQGMVKSGSASSVNSTGSHVKVDVVSDMKKAPSGSNISAARASPIVGQRAHRLSTGRAPIQEEGSHEVRVIGEGGKGIQLSSSAPEYSSKANVKDPLGVEKDLEDLNLKDSESEGEIDTAVEAAGALGNPGSCGHKTETEMNCLTNNSSEEKPQSEKSGKKRGIFNFKYLTKKKKDKDSE